MGLCLVLGSQGNELIESVVNPVEFVGHFLKSEVGRRLLKGNIRTFSGKLHRPECHRRRRNWWSKASTYALHYSELGLDP